MSTEKYKNAGQTTLNGTITSGATSIVVTDATQFPASVQYRILIDSEYMLVTAIASNTLTVTRGAEGSTAAAHTTGATVWGVLTAGALDQIRSDISTTAAWASRSAAEKDGRVFFPNNSLQISRENGAAWASFGPIFALTEPIDANYSWINQGGASVDTTNGGIYLLAPASGVDNLRIRKKAAPATPYKITAAFLPVWDSANQFVHLGLCFRESSSGKLVTFGPSLDANINNNPTTAVNLSVTKWTNETTFNNYYRETRMVNLPMMPTFYRIADDGTTRTCSYSVDGQHFIQHHAVSRTDYMTADQVGFFVDSNNSAAAAMTLISWLEG